MHNILNIIIFFFYKTTSIEVLAILKFFEKMINFYAKGQTLHYIITSADKMVSRVCF